MANRKISELDQLTGTSDDDVIPVVDTSAGLTKKIEVGDLLANQITSTERTKLAGIEEGATANSSDAHLLNRANQTGTQPASSISDFNTQVTQVISDGGGGASDADLRDRSTHTGFQTLSTISDAGTSASLNVPATGDATVGEVVKGNDTRLSDARTPTAHTHTASQITDFNSKVDTRIGSTAPASHNHTASEISDFSSAVSTEITNNAGAGHGTGTVTEHNDVSSAGSGQIITSTERTKLSGIATGATANSSDASLKNRANHTGTQANTTITGLGTASTKDVGTGAGNVVQLTPSGTHAGKLPAVDGSRLTNIALSLSS